MRRLDHGQGLGHQHDVHAVPAVGQDAGQRRHEKDGHLGEKSHQPEVEGRAGQAVDQPAHGHLLHPGAGQRDALAAEIEAVVAVAQGAQGRSSVRKKRRSQHFALSHGLPAARRCSSRIFRPMAIRITPPRTSTLPASQRPEPVADEHGRQGEAEGHQADDQHRDDDVDGQQGKAEAHGQGVDAGGHGQAQHDRQAQAVGLAASSRGRAALRRIILPPMNASRMKASQWSKPAMTFLKPRPASQPMTGISVWNKPKSESQAQGLAQLHLPGGAAAGHGHGHGVHGQAQGDEQDGHEIHMDHLRQHFQRGTAAKASGRKPGP